MKIRKNKPYPNPFSIQFIAFTFIYFSSELMCDETISLRLSVGAVLLWGNDFVLFMFIQVIHGLLDRVMQLLEVAPTVDKANNPQQGYHIRRADCKYTNKCWKQLD